MNIYSPKNLSNIQKAIKMSQEITNNNIIFINITGAIVDCNTLLFDLNISTDYLRTLNFKSYFIFPLVIETNLYGFFILGNSNIESDAISLCGKYIEISCKKYIKSSDEQITILSPLKGSKLNTLVNTLNGILNISETDPITKVSTPSLINNSNESLSDIDKNILMALKYINSNLEKSLTLENVSQKIYLSPSYLSRIFKNYFNDNFINYINLQKIALAQEKLIFSNIPINKLAHHVGFSQTSYFTKIFKQKVGMTPSKYRKYNSGIKKIYTIHRDLYWHSNKSVYDISKEFFNKNNISFKAHDMNGYPYIYSINDLNDIRGKAGWIYTVDCSQPITPASEISVSDRSVVQWIYTENKQS